MCQARLLAARFPALPDRLMTRQGIVFHINECRRHTHRAPPGSHRGHALCAAPHTALSAEGPQEHKKQERQERKPQE